MRQRVLIVDDAASVRQLAEARLSGEGHELHGAATGADGLKLAARLLPDVILLDADLPDIDGLTVCRSLKSQPATMGIPVVLLVGATSAEEKLRALEVGAIDYLTKPFDPAELKARVRAALKTKYLLDLLASKAMIDGVSGLWNRSYFEQRLTAELSLSRRTNDPLACMKVGLDQFQPIADKLGHPAADEAIRQVGQRLLESVRLEDVVCRCEPDRFGIVLPNAAMGGASVVAERMRQKAAERPIDLHGKPLVVSVSVGIAPVEAAIDLSIAHADDALSLALRRTGNRVEVWRSPLNRNAA